MAKLDSSLENKSFVVCKICNFHNKNIAHHLRMIHNITIKDYKVKYNSETICENSLSSYSKASVGRMNYVEYAKLNNIDLTEYKLNMSKSVRKAIMSNPDERKRRSNMMKTLNETVFTSDYHRKIMSDTAKATSSRPEILAQRSVALAKWRKNYPDEFYEKCIKKMMTSWDSKPERLLFEFLLTIDGFHFKRNKFVKSIKFTSLSKRRQVDIVDIDKRVYVEFDGVFHFENIFGDDILNKNIIKDKEVDEFMLSNNYTLIRVSYDQFIDKSKVENCEFKKECRDSILEILHSKTPGVYKIGNKYE